MNADTVPTIHHIPVCPFSQRLQILLALKGLSDRVRFNVVDVTEPRPAWLLAMTHGTTALPVLDVGEAEAIKESMVMLRYFDERLPEPTVRQRDPYRHAIESMLTAMEGDFCARGYLFVMNQDPARRDTHRDAMLAQYRRLDDFLVHHSPGGTFLFDGFGWAETVFTPFFMRFWFLEYYEDFDLPDTGEYARVRRWRDACLAHPAAQQVTREEIVKVYYDYAKGSGNGALLAGRRKSSFSFEPGWRSRPWPPKDKYAHGATDEELGLS